MRSDKTRGATFVNADSWKHQKYRDGLFVRLENGPPFFKTNSFSGNEPNHLYLNTGERFQNLTLVSGADHSGDGRGFAILDYDQDGWLDIALVSTNTPRFKLLRNQLGGVVDGQRTLLNLIGANSNSNSSERNSNRDAIGAKAKVTFQSGRKQMFQKQVGEGNVAQNSEALWIGHRLDDPIASIQVTWPSGKTSTIDDPGSDKAIDLVEPE